MNHIVKNKCHACDHNMHSQDEDTKDHRAFLNNRIEFQNFQSQRFQFRSNKPVNEHNIPIKDKDAENCRVFIRNRVGRFPLDHIYTILVDF